MNRQPANRESPSEVIRLWRLGRCLRLTSSFIPDLFGCAHYLRVRFVVERIVRRVRAIATLFAARIAVITHLVHLCYVTRTFVRRSSFRRGDFVRYVSDCACSRNGARFLIRSWYVTKVDCRCSVRLDVIFGLTNVLRNETSAVTVDTVRSGSGATTDFSR